MVNFELGNPETIEDLVSSDFVFGKFVFKRNGSTYRLFLGEYESHSDLVKGLKILDEDEIPANIWGGGEFRVMSGELEFSGLSGSYGKVPNSFLIACCKEVKIPHIEKFTFSLFPYDLRDPELDARRETWREIGGFELDTDEKKYVFDGNMVLIREQTIS